MKMYGIITGACFLGLSLLTSGLTSTVTPPSAANDKGGADVSPKRIEQLIKQLGSNRFADREEAHKELEAIGAPAIEFLRKQIKSADPESSHRMTEIVRRFEQKSFAASILAPKKIRLNLLDVSVLDAVADLKKQSGYDIQIEGDTSVLAKRKISLETGEVSFFEALDQLCIKGGLTEKMPNNGGALAGGAGGIGGIFEDVIIIEQLRVIPVQPGQAVPLPVPLPDLKKLDNQQKKNPEKIQDENGKQKQPANPPAPPQANLIPGLDIGKVLKALDVQIVGQVGGNEAKIQIQPPPVPQPPAVPGAAPLPAIPLIQGQVQVQGIQMLPGGFQQQRNGNPQQIILADGKPLVVPTCYVGSARIRLLPANSVKVPIQPGEVLLVFEISAEPRLPIFQPVGAPNIVRAKDDQDQLLLPIELKQADPQLGQFQPFINPYLRGQQRIIPVRLKLGDKKAQLLKELAGAFSVQVQGPLVTVAAIDNVLNAKRQTAKGTDNESMTLVNIDRADEQTYRVEVMMETNNQNGGLGGFIQVNSDNSNVLPDLVDGQGKAYQRGKVMRGKIEINNAVRQIYVVEYRADAGQGQPTRLVWSEKRNTSIAVPFEFKDIPLQ